LQHQVVQRAGALDLQHDRGAGLELPQGFLQFRQVLNGRAVDCVNHVAGLWTFSQQGVGGSPCRDQHATRDAHVPAAQHLFQLAGNVNGHDAQAVHEIVRTADQIGKPRGVVRPLSYANGESRTFPIAQDADFRLLADLVGVEIERELANIIHRLAANSGNDVTDVQAGFLRRRTRYYILQQHAVVHRQIQSGEQVGRDGTKADPNLAAVHMAPSPDLVIDAANNVAGNGEPQPFVAA